MIERQWVNVSAIVNSLVLLLFAMVQITLALGLNLRFSNWSITITSATPDPTILSTAVLMITDGLFVFPAAITGICAAVSRNGSVYIVLMVVDCLAFLATISGLITISYIFGMNGMFSDGGSINDELAISIMVFQALLIVMTLFLGIAAIIALVHRERSHHNREPYKPRYEKHISDYQPTRYMDTVPFQAAPAARPKAKANSLGGAYYRPLTYGSPEWDRFYDQLWKGYSVGAPKGSRPERYNSYRY